MKEIVVADLNSPKDAKAVVELLNEYALCEAGGGNSLSDYTKSNLIAELKQRPNCRIVLAYVDGEQAGLGICFEAFSTFKCKPILNIHDFIVSEKYRGQKLSKDMLSKIEEVAKESGCCKLTLEVLDGNEIAKNAYKSFGFEGYELDPKMGKALFLEKAFE